MYWQQHFDITLKSLPLFTKILPDLNVILCCIWLVQIINYLSLCTEEASSWFILPLHIKNNRHINNTLWGSDCNLASAQHLVTRTT